MIAVSPTYAYYLCQPTHSPGRDDVVSATWPSIGHAARLFSHLSEGSRRASLIASTLLRLTANGTVQLVWVEEPMISSQLTGSCGNSTSQTSWT
jgi:hypothetical protein